MAQHFTIELTLNENTGGVEALAMTEGLYSRTEFVMEDIDEPISIRHAMTAIREELEWIVKK